MAYPDQNPNSSITVTANAGTNLNTSSLALDNSVNGLLVTQGSTTSGQSGPLVQTATTTNAPSYSTAKTNPLSTDTSGLLRVSLKDTPANTNKLLVTADPITFASAQSVNATLAAETTKVIGTVNQGTSPWVTSTVLTTGSAQIGHLEANQSINNAQIGGSTIVASVTGVQDVMPRKRTGSTGLAPNYYAGHITSKTTTTPTSSTAYVSSIAISCSAAGTSWTMVIRDKQATPLILVPSFTLTAPTTGLPIILQFPEPIVMTSGIDIITAGTTAGTVDVFITYWQ